MSTLNAQRERTILAAATRLGVRYRPTWPLAILVAATVLVSAAVAIDQIDAWIDASGVRVRSDATSPEFERLRTASIAMAVSLTVSVLAWSTWIALVVANVPALVAQWPPNSPFGAFFAPFVPFANLVRPYAVVRSVVVLLTRGSWLPPLIALGWWLAFLATYFAPTIVLLLNGTLALGGPGDFPALANGLRVRQLLLVVAAGLALAVLVTVEWLQRAALARRAEVVVAGP